MLGALLALFALAGAFGVNGWHASMTYHHDIVTTIASSDHGDEDHGSASMELHGAAHAIATGWITATQTEVPMLPTAGGSDWSLGLRDPVAAVHPSTPLRPPIA